MRIQKCDSSLEHRGVESSSPVRPTTDGWREVDTVIDDMEERLTPRHHELYAKHVAELRRNIGRLAIDATPPERRAAVERALTARRPRARYRSVAPPTPSSP